MSQDIQLLDPYEDPDAIRCQRYVYLREVSNPRLTMQKVADEFGINRVTLYEKVARWKASGLLAAVRRLMMIEVTEDIEAAYSELLADTPAIIRRQRDIAINSKSDFHATNSASLLFPMIDRLREESADTGSMEKDYIVGLARTIQIFDPLEIPSDAPHVEEGDLDTDSP